jgi:pyrroline-5-carboxylate reductase
VGSRSPPSRPPIRAADGPEDEILALFGRVGTVVALPEEQMETATAVMSCAPAWIALVAEALVDAGARQGLEQEQAERLVAQAVAGTGDLLVGLEVTPEELRRRVTSPGGLTERGTKALEEAGIRDAFDAAVKAVVNA